jgi:hypothetical protein
MINRETKARNMFLKISREFEKPGFSRAEYKNLSFADEETGFRSLVATHVKRVIRY